MNNVNKETEKNQSNFMPVVGIDLGTTNSAVAYIRKGKAEIIPSTEGERIIPSVVHINAKGNIVVGQDAADALVAMPSRTIAEVKRKMGSQEALSIADKELLPHEVSSLIIKELKVYVDELLGEGDKEAVITVPAYFTDEQRRATKKAGELAGFKVDRIINEPTAAAMAYGLDHLEEDSHILIYDLGGGTFDVSVVELMQGVMEVKASTGNNELGGTDFDWSLVDFMAEKIKAEHDIDPREDLRAKALLKEEAEKVKINLSSVESVEISIPVVTVVDNQPIGLDLEISRDEFITLIEDKLKETMDSVETVLEESSLDKSEIDHILLVGGSTRIPKVQELITDYFKKKPRTDINPDEAVALGAAVQAGLKSGALSKSGLIVTDVAPYSMGIAVLQGWKGMMLRPGGFSVIIPKNTTVPVTKSETYTTSADDQTAVSIEIYQGEGEWVKENHPLGEFVLEGIPANKAGEEKIDVTFRYNLNGILEVTAESVTTGEQMSITVQDALERTSEDAYKNSMEGLEEYLDNAAAKSAEEEEKLEGEMDDIFSQFIRNQKDKDEKEDIVIEPESLSQLKEEADFLIERAEKILENPDNEGHLKVEHLVVKLEEAIESEDRQLLKENIDKLTDELIDLEFQEGETE